MRARGGGEQCAPALVAEPLGPARTAVYGADPAPGELEAMQAAHVAGRRRPDPAPGGYPAGTASKASSPAQLMIVIRPVNTFGRAP